MNKAVAYVPHTTVYVTPPCDDFSTLDISSAGIVPVPKRIGVEKMHLTESFPKAYRSVVAPSWFVEQSRVENRPRGVWHTPPCTVGLHRKMMVTNKRFWVKP